LIAVIDDSDELEDRLYTDALSQGEILGWCFFIVALLLLLTHHQLAWPSERIGYSLLLLGALQAGLAAHIRLRANSV